MEIFLAVRVGKVRRAGRRVDDDMLFDAASSLRILAAMTYVFTLLLYVIITHLMLRLLNHFTSIRSEVMMLCMHAG